MTNRIDWGNHFISFVLVIASILLAFQLERCGTDRREDRLVQRHLAEIEQETEFNLRLVDQNLASLRDLSTRLDTVLQLIYTTDDAARINRELMGALNLPVLYLKQTGYRNFTTSSDIRFLDDFERKANLITLYEYYQQSEALNEVLLEMYRNQYFGYMQQHLDLYRGRPRPIAVYREPAFINGISSVRYFTHQCTLNLSKLRGRMQRYRVGEDVSDDVDEAS